MLENMESPKPQPQPARLESGQDIDAPTVYELLNRDSMEYHRPPQEPARIYAPTTILHETSPTMITPLSRLGKQPEQTDCPYCEKVVETQVLEVDSGNNEQVSSSVCLEQ